MSTNSIERSCQVASIEGSCQGYVSKIVKFGLGCLHQVLVSGIRFRIRKIWSRLPPSRGRVRDISCACEQQQGTIPSTFAVCNVDYIVDVSSSDRIAREHFRFLEHRF